MGLLGGSAKIKSTLKDGTANFYPVNRKVEESREMFRYLINAETGVEEKVEGLFIRVGSLSELRPLVEKYNGRFTLVKSKYLDLPFDVKIKREWLWLKILRFIRMRWFH